jgi:uncharacterized integral membrane protein (TIGR00697 family)
MTKELNNTKKYYYHIGLFFVICLIISNLGATKLINLLGLTVPGGIVIFPLLYVLNDALTEVYGFRASRQIIWVAMLCNMVISVVLYFIVLIPSGTEAWTNADAFKSVFSLSPLIFIASTLSYLIGELINATIIAWLKIKMSGKLFAFRAIFSTLIGAFVETVIFCFMVFANKMDFLTLMSIVLNMICIKVSYEILIMPVTLKCINYLKNREGLDVFEAPNLWAILPTIR